MVTQTGEFDSTARMSNVADSADASAAWEQKHPPGGPWTRVGAGAQQTPAQADRGGFPTSRE
jgi:hypothetical protein